MAIRDSQTGRLWSGKESDGFAAIYAAIIAKKIEAAKKGKDA